MVSGTDVHQGLQGLSRAAFYLALLSLPWINEIHASTFLLIVSSIAVLLSGNLVKSIRVLIRKPLFWSLCVYYVLQVFAYILYPESMTRLPIEQKASLVAIPILTFALIKNGDDWKRAMWFFTAGTLVALLQCMIAAITTYATTQNISVFFYHTYSSAVGMNAIYFSMYIIVALVYLIRDEISSLLKSTVERNIYPVIIVFLFFNLLLLDSKISIVIGTVICVILLLRKLTTRVQKLSLGIALVALYVILLLTNNPIKKRYDNIDFRQATDVLYKDDFANYSFDGLNLRMLLWRFGAESLNEQSAWLQGLGGKHYHSSVNEKTTAHGLYIGDRVSDNGYLNYNMHNQYIETLVQFGLLGLFLLGYWIVCFFRSSFFSSSSARNPIVIAFALVFLTESFLETQSGILLFTIILSGEWLNSLKKENLLKS